MSKHPDPLSPNLGTAYRSALQNYNKSFYFARKMRCFRANLKEEEGVLVYDFGILVYDFGGLCRKFHPTLHTFLATSRMPEKDS